MVAARKNREGSDTVEGMTQEPTELAGTGPAVGSKHSFGPVRTGILVTEKPR